MNPTPSKLTQALGAVLILGYCGLSNSASAHTNSVGFDLKDNGDGTCDLEWYYGSWHSNTGIGPEGAFSLYTLGSSAELSALGLGSTPDATNPSHYVHEAYGTGGSIRNETNYYTWPGKDTARITLNQDFERNINSTSSSVGYEEDGPDGGSTEGRDDIEIAGFVPGETYFFAQGSNLDDKSQQFSSTISSKVYSHQSATIKSVAQGTYRGFYDGEGNWDSTNPPASTPTITADFDPEPAIETALVTISGGCQLTFGDPPNVTISSVDNDNGASSNDFVTSGRNVVVRGTYNQAATALTVQFGATTYTLGTDGELSTTGGDWTLTLGTEQPPGTYAIVATATVNGTSSSATGSLDIVRASIEAISEDTGLSGDDFVTGDQTLIITGLYSAATADSLSVTVNGVTYTLNGSAAQDVRLSASGDDWALNLTSQALAIGTYPVTVSVGEGGQDYTATQTIEVVAAPPTPTIDAITDDTDTAGDFVTTDDRLIITGTYDASESTGGLSVLLVGINYPLSGSELSASGDNWSLNVTGRSLGVGNHTVTVTATNSSGVTSSASRVINVVATAASSPVITDQTVSLSENSQVGAEVYDFSDASGGDTDADGDALTYSIASGNFGSPFAIDAATGKVTVASPSQIDYEVNTSFVLIISATDGTYSDTAQLKINITQADSDGDGVDEGTDQCPNTPVDEDADANGCGPSQKDTDGDGVTDDLDQCPATASDEDADANGCGPSQKDTDGDGVTDDLDQCPATASDEDADANGCGPSQKDTDGDGVTDDVDQCPATASGVIVASDGCTDTDEDGTSDTNDAFPTDPNEDTDADNDGVGDNADTDPTDANSDTDGDGISDADETSNGTDPVDSDSDDDGVDDGTEEANGTDPVVSDTDGDGSDDGTDDFPLAVTSGVSTGTEAVTVRTQPGTEFSTCSITGSVTSSTVPTIKPGVAVDGVGVAIGFALSGCQSSSAESIRLTLDYGKALPTGGVPYIVDGGTGDWTEVTGATLDAQSVTYDFPVEGGVTKQVTVAVPLPPVPVPGLGRYGLLLLILLMAGMAARLR